MTVAAWAARHTRSVVLLLAIAVAGGVFSLFQLPIGLFPHVDFPRVRVSLEAGDRPAERMAVEVTYVVEEAVRAVPGVRSVRSTTSRGSAELSANFDWGRDMVAAMLEVSTQIGRVLPSLPQGTTFVVERMDPTVFPVIAYSITSADRPLTELHDFAMYELRPALSTVTGVARIGVQGGQVEEYRVVVDRGRLEALGLGDDDVAAALSSANVITAVGRLEDRGKLFLAVSDSRFSSVEDIGGVVVRAGPTGLVRVRDVASVQRSTEPNFTRVTADGRDAVLIQVYQQPDGNTVQVARDIAARLEEQRARLPALQSGSIRLATWYDQSRLILASERSARDAIVLGVVLAALVLLVFLRDWRATLIATLAVPAVVGATMLVLQVLGMSVNLMTLGGIAAAVGLVIDDNIVMVEHVVRRLRAAGPGAVPVLAEPDQRRQRVVHAATEFTRPLAGSSLSTIVIFLPLAFLTGVTGAFFKALAVTMSGALLISFAVAWLAIPVVAGKWLRPHAETNGRPGRLARGYDRAMRLLLPRPWVALIVAAVIAGGGYLALRAVPSGFLPEMDEGGFILDYVAPPGTSLRETDRMLREVEAIISSNPAVATYSRRTGLQLGGGLSEANIGDFFIELKPFPRPPISEIMDDVRQQVERTVPGLQVELLQLMEDLIGDLTAVPQPIEIKVFSDDQSVLDTLAPRIAAAIEKVEGVVEVKNGIVPAGDTLDIVVDRERAALAGVDPEAVTRLARTALSGNVATQVLRAPKLMGVRVWTPERGRATQDDLRNLLLHAANGRIFPLGQVAEIRTVTGEPEIQRDDLRRMAAVTARISGRDLGSTVADVKRALATPGLIPVGINYQLGGLYEQQQIAFRGQLNVLIAAIVLVFALLVFLYERFLMAAAVLTTTLLATACVLVGLWVTGTELNIASFMGMTMIVGIVTEVGIFYCSEFVSLPEDVRGIDRLIAAGTGRTRAIAMTTTAAILALLPLAIGLEHGSELLRPLAIAIIAGLAAQLPLVLVVLPALLAFSGARGPS